MTNYYRLWVTTKTDDGYSARMYGWSRGKKYRFTEAMHMRDKLMRDEEYNFHSVEIVEA